MIAPALIRSSEISFRLGLLVYGSVGKTVATMEAAKALGMKYICVDCLDLPLSSFIDVQKHLETLGKEAKSFAPCFFILKRIQYLSTWMQDVSKANPANSASSVSSILHKLTQQSGNDAET